MPLADLGLVQAVQGPGRLHVRPQQWRVAESLARRPTPPGWRPGSAAHISSAQRFAASTSPMTASALTAHHDVGTNAPSTPAKPSSAGGTDGGTGRTRRRGRRWWRARAGVCARRRRPEAGRGGATARPASGVVSPGSNVCGRRPVARIGHRLDAGAGGSARRDPRRAAGARVGTGVAAGWPGRRPLQRASSSPTSHCSRRSSQMPLVGSKGASASVVAKQSTTGHAAPIHPPAARPCTGRPPRARWRRRRAGAGPARCRRAPAGSWPSPRRRERALLGTGSPGRRGHGRSPSSSTRPATNTMYRRGGGEVPELARPSRRRAPSRAAS